MIFDIAFYLGQGGTVVVLLMSSALDLVFDTLFHGFVLAAAHIGKMPAAVGYTHHQMLLLFVTQLLGGVVFQHAVFTDLGAQPLSVSAGDAVKLAGHGKQIAGFFFHIHIAVEITLCQGIDLAVIKIVQHPSDCIRIGDLVHIGKNDHIIIIGPLKTSCHSLFLMAVTHKGIGIGTHGRIVHHSVNDLVLELCKHFLIFLEIQGLFHTGKSHCGFTDHKLVHHIVHHTHTQQQNVQFIEKLKTIVYHTDSYFFIILLSLRSTRKSSSGFPLNFG